MSPQILIINGHPNKESLCFALANAYKEGAIRAGATVKELVIADLQFNPNLQYGYRKRIDWERIWPQPGKAFNGPITWFGCTRFGGVACRL
ncbi:NAD(P)H-dependent oxidoreductase [Niabella sp. W65]|nr:NAD(P)H-dependent oxidoreductase [Niabella sp. W65]MCH7368132.1 NAD(P)H-dependent oxidoreductase [Niabella sp. W65]